ncbi:MmgE/PrpD family protein [Alkalihalobacillus sp. BA299]|uniref:MmgE/PrpD family protein n=1 Tax=Alkalihalobacillus sp. BA299 TaxID=2815938 RepID=UPI001ADB9AA9|nr:MmgE/PrpD family protein [Alkalihalobacillus sp. BA299]
MLENLKKLSTFAYQFNSEDVESDILNRAKLIILDSITAIVHGNQTKEVHKFAQSLCSEKQSSRLNLVSIYGTSHYTESNIAAMINGLGMVSEEMDEGNPIAKGHPSCHFLPSLLATADLKKMDGKTFLESFIVGYETGARMGSAVTLKKNIHPHGNWGTIGSAFALGKANDFNKEDYMNAFSVIGSLTYVSLWQPVLEGHRMRDIYIGLNNLNSLLVPHLITAGYSSESNSLREVFTNILGEGFNEQKLTEDLGKDYYLMKTYFKFYPFCRFCHPPIDAVNKLIEKVDFTSEEIEKLDVYTYSLASKLNKKSVNNKYAGMFSIPFSLAKTVLNIKCPEESSFEEIINLAKKIEVVEDEQLTKLLPSRRAARIELTLVNGQVHTETTMGAKGDSWEEDIETKVIRKCEQMLGEVIGSTKTLELIHNVMNLENVQNIHNITKLTEVKLNV